MVNAAASEQSEETRRARDRRFVAWLERQVPRESPTGQPAGNRAVISTLRRAAGIPPGEALSVYSVLYQALDEGPLAPWEEVPYLVVAPLFALYPEGGWRGAGAVPGWQSRNLGASFALLSQKTDSVSIERRFRALLDSRLVDLPEHLRHAISLLRAHEVPVSWTDLLRDLRKWSYPDRPVQRDWARTYWGATTRTERDAGSTEEPPNDSDELDEEEN